MRHIVLYGGSFNPPCLHHIALVRVIAINPFFHETVVIPCGRRMDKSYVDNEYRIQMLQNAFAGIRGVALDMRNLERDIFTSNYHLEALYQSSGVMLWHAIGSDLLVRSEDGINLIQRRWTEGRFIWENFRFLVIPRIGYQVIPELLPKRHIVLRHEFVGSSTDVRNAIRKGAPIEHLVDPETYNLIVSKKLYL